MYNKYKEKVKKVRKLYNEYRDLVEEEKENLSKVWRGRYKLTLTVNPEMKGQRYYEAAKVVAKLFTSTILYNKNKYSSIEYSYVARITHAQFMSLVGDQKIFFSPCFYELFKNSEYAQKFLYSKCDGHRIDRFKKYFIPKITKYYEYTYRFPAYYSNLSRRLYGGEGLYFRFLTDKSKKSKSEKIYNKRNLKRSKKRINKELQNQIREGFDLLEIM